MIKFVLMLSLIFPTMAYAEDMKFWLASSGGNCNSCQWIAADGEIVEDTPNNLKKFLSEINHKSGQELRITINSIGGNLMAGLELGRIIRENKLTTSISKTIKLYLNGQETPYDDEEFGICHSACAYAFLGGVNRFIGDKSKYGVHQFYNEDAIKNPLKEKFNSLDLSKSQIIMGLLTSYIYEMGADAALLKLSSQTTPWQEIYILSKEELTKYRVDNSTLVTANWELKPIDSGLAAIVSQKQKQPEEGVKTLSIFCTKKDRSINMIIGGEYGTANIDQYYSGSIDDALLKSNEVEINDSNTNREIFKSTLSVKQKNKKNESYQILFGAKIPITQLKVMLESENIDTYIDLPQRYFFVSHSFFPIKNGKKEIIAALNNCL